MEVRTIYHKLEFWLTQDEFLDTVVCPVNGYGVLFTVANKQIFLFKHVYFILFDRVLQVSLLGPT